MSIFLSSLSSEDLSIKYWFLFNIVGILTLLHHTWEWFHKVDACEMSDDKNFVHKIILLEWIICVINLASVFLVPEIYMIWTIPWNKCWWNDIITRPIWIIRTTWQIHGIFHGVITSVNTFQWPRHFRSRKNILKKGKAIPVNRLWMPIGLWDIKVPTFSRQLAHRWRWGCQPYTLAALYTQ
jgi:hypothetical protein